MAKIHVGARVEPAMIARLDKLALALSAQMKGVQVNRSEVARIALERGVEAIEVEVAKDQKGSKPPRKPR